MDKKLNNLLKFSDFVKNWNPEKPKKTKRTNIGLDIVKEDIRDGKEVKKTIKPDLYAVKIDETQHWRDDIKEKAGKIWGVYLMDKSEITHLASLEGSYYLYWLYNIVENFEDFEENELSDIEYQNGGNADDPNMYVSEHTKFNEEDKVNWDETELEESIESEETYKELIDDVVEYLNGNHPF